MDVNLNKECEHTQVLAWRFVGRRDVPLPNRNPTFAAASSRDSFVFDRAT